MLTAADGIARSRPFAAALFDREFRRSGSKMTAYSSVASTIGVSESWLRKLLGRQNVVVAVHEYLNLADAYRRLCERVEAEVELERQRSAALREAAHAALESPGELVAGTSGATNARASSSAEALTKTVRGAAHG